VLGSQAAQEGLTQELSRGRPNIYQFRQIPELGLCMSVSLEPANGQMPQRLDFSEYLDGLFGYAMVLSRNRAEAEDLVQETCLRALRGMDGLRSNDSAKSWLFTILRNIWLNQLRHRRTVPELIELDADGNGASEPSDSKQDPHADYVSQVTREFVRDAIEQLPVEFREIIILREYEDLSYQEIAALLECPPGTVMSRLARARSRLRELLSRPVSVPESERRHPGQSSGATA
jgi:RNA polymerase sigma-70 factor, ECF subfamily